MTVQVKATGTRHIPILTVLVSVFGAGTALAQARYPPGKTVAKLTWDSNPVRISEGPGDNWPLVEGEDGALYVTYGDGGGFGKRNPKLSLGFAKMTGEFPNYTGVDIPGNIDAVMGGGPEFVQFGRNYQGAHPA